MEKEYTSLGGGGCELLIPFNERLPLADIERSIIKTYRKTLWTPFTKAVKEFELIKDGDRIAVGVSGGKDSLLLCKLFQEIQRHGKVSFELVFLAMDPGYHDSNREALKENCRHLGIPLTLYESGIFEVVDKIAQDYPCYMCAKMRRGALYAKAQELGCNRLALGHHMDDVIETTMMNILYAGSFKTMMPRLKSKNFKGLELIRPMYYIREEDIKRFTLNAGLSPMNCGCVVAAKKVGGTRKEIKGLIEGLSDMNPDVAKCILNAGKNVNMDCVVGWSGKDGRHSFLDGFDEDEA